MGRLSSLPGHLPCAHFLNTLVKHSRLPRNTPVDCVDCVTHPCGCECAIPDEYWGGRGGGGGHGALLADGPLSSASSACVRPKRVRLTLTRERKGLCVTLLLPNLAWHALCAGGSQSHAWWQVWWLSGVVARIVARVVALRRGGTHYAVAHTRGGTYGNSKSSCDMRCALTRSLTCARVSLASGLLFPRIVLSAL